MCVCLYHPSIGHAQLRPTGWDTTRASMAARKSGCLLRNVPLLGGGGARSANATDLPANVGWALAEDGTIIYRDTESGKKAAAAGALGLYFSANGIAHVPPLPSGALIDAAQGFYIRDGGMFPHRPRSREFTAVFGGKGMAQPPPPDTCTCPTKPP